MKTSNAMIEVMKIMMPVGYIFEHDPTDTSGPVLDTPEKVHNYFGFGTWEVYGKYMFLTCDPDKVGVKGGSNSHRHNLSDQGCAQIGNYGQHTAFRGQGNGWAKNYVDALGDVYFWQHNGDSKMTSSSPTYNESRLVGLGGTTDDTIALPPYINVYRYRRIA